MVIILTTFDRIKQLPKDRNETPTSVALKLGSEENLFYKWKSQSTTSDKLEKVADYFNVSTDYLLCKTNNKTDIEDTGFEIKNPKIKILARKVYNQNLNNEQLDSLNDVINSVFKIFLTTKMKKINLIIRMLDLWLTIYLKVAYDAF